MPRKNSRTPPARAGEPHSFSRTTAALGIPQFNEHFKRHFNTQIAISGISIPGNNITISLSCDAFPQITISIQPVHQTDVYFMRTDHLAISKVEDDHERIFPIYEYFIKYLSKRLEKVAHDRLLDLVRGDEFRFSDNASFFRTTDLERPFYGWGGQWRSFLCRQALVRNLDSSIHIINPKIHVGIAEAECHYATLPMSPNLTHYHNYPCVQRKVSEPVCRDRGYEVELVDSDIIMGTRDKLEQLLDLATRDITGMDMITINSTCVSYVIGEDYEDIGAATQRDCGLPVFYSSSAINNEIDVFANMVRHYMGDCSATRKPKSASPSINLFGFQHTPDVEECLALLADLGISINMRFYPVIDFNELKKFGQASANIVFPSVYYINLYSAIFGETAINDVAPNAPYGLELTRQWLADIAAATNTRKSVEAHWNGLFQNMEDKWNDLRRRACRHRMGFVLDPFDLETLLDPKSYWGVNPFTFLDEMGFQLDILFYGDNAHTKDFVRDKLKDTLERPETLGVQTFRTPRELERLLKRAKCKAVFSDFFFDRRLTANGKAQFSLQDFEMGAQGAIRTIERLLRICELPFYRDYGAYLQGRSN